MSRKGRGKRFRPLKSAVTVSSGSSKTNDTSVSTVTPADTTSS